MKKSCFLSPQSTECLSKASVPDMDTGNAGTLEAPGEAGSKVRPLSKFPRDEIRFQFQTWQQVVN